MPENHIVYLIGFMGSGKSTAGKKLASSLGWTFVDLDKAIEEVEGSTIPEIFAEKGEDHFRQLESEMLRKLQLKQNTVISAGGGTPCFGDNIDFMLETGVTIYLKLTPGQLRSRLAGAQQERPLLKGLDSEGMLEFIREKLGSREKWYTRAEFIVDGFDPDIKYLQKIILGRLGGLKPG
jgi:shikimate kinase